MRALITLFNIILIVITSCLSNSKTTKFDDLKKKISSQRIIRDKEILEMFFIEGDTATINTKIFYSDTIKYKGKDCFLFFSKSLPSDNKYVSALLTSALDVQIYDCDSYKFMYQKYFAQSGNFGGDPVYSTLKFGHDNIGMVLENGGTQMGITSGSLEVFKFVDNDFRQVLILDSAFYDNSGYVGDDTLSLKTSKTSISLVDDSENELLIIRQMKQYDEKVNRVTSTEKNERFTFDNTAGRYEKESGKTL